MLKHEEAESSLVGLLLRCKQQYFCLLLNNFTVSTSTSPTMPWPKSSGFLGAVHCHYQGFWKKKLITLADQMYFNLRTCHNSHFKGRSQTERFFSPFGYICSVFTAFFNGATIRENIWSFCMRINSINNNRDYVCGWEWSSQTIHTCAWGQALGPNKSAWLSGLFYLHGTCCNLTTS